MKRQNFDTVNNVNLNILTYVRTSICLEFSMNQHFLYDVTFALITGLFVGRNFRP